MRHTLNTFDYQRLRIGFRRVARDAADFEFTGGFGSLGMDLQNLLNFQWHRKRRELTFGP